MQYTAATLRNTIFHVSGVKNVCAVVIHIFLILALKNIQTKGIRSWNVNASEELPEF